MNKFKNLLLISTVLSIIMGGCSLNEQLLDTPTPSNFIQSQNEVEAMLAGAYNSMEDPVYRGHLYRFLFFLPDHLYNTTYKTQSDKFNMNTSDASASLLWRNFYWGIRDANHLMRDMNNIVLPDDYRRKATGECLFLRGWTYYELVRLFGGVPIRTAAVDLTSELNVPRSPEKEVYKQIFADLKMASALLPLKNTQAAKDRNRANKGAAQSMLASAYLTYGVEYNDAKALDSAILYSDSVINSGQYKLAKNFADLWDIAKENSAVVNDEVIWRVSIIGDASNRGTALPKFFTPSTVSGMSYGPLGSGDFKVQPWFYNLVSQGDYKGDYRTEVSFYTRWTRPNGREAVCYPLLPLTSNPQTFESAPYVAKYKDPAGTGFYLHSNDWFCMRFAEIYLIKAEAENELHGATQVAYDAFNKIRERSRFANGTTRTFPANLTPGLNKEEFRRKILDERSVEFVAEGKRWYDLKRIKYTDGRTMYEYMFEDYLPSLPQGLPTYNTAQKKWLGGVTFPTSLLMDKDGNKLPVNPATYLLLPIPFDEVNNNAMIGPEDQNPGY